SHRFNNIIYRNQVEANLVITNVQQRQASRPQQQVKDQVIDPVVLDRFSGNRIATNHCWTMNRYWQFSFKVVDFEFSEVLRFFVMVTKARVVSHLSFENSSLPFPGNITR